MIIAMQTRYPSSRSPHLWLCLTASIVIFSQSLYATASQSRVDRQLFVKTAVEQTSIVPDQLAQAAIRSDQHGRIYPRLATSMRILAKEPSTVYNYGKLENNLIRPEHESTLLRTQDNHNRSKTAESDVTIGSVAAKSALLEDSKTAAEYVTNAMKMIYSEQQKVPQRIATSRFSAEDHRLQQRQQLEQATLIKAEAQAQATLPKNSEHAELQTYQPAKPTTDQPWRPQQMPQMEQLHSSESSATSSAPAPIYEKDSVPRSYELYESANKAVDGGDIERLYHTRYYSHPTMQQQRQPQLYRNLEDEAEEKVRVSASTEIPKSEILKHIEKSVIKYMKELEAEGKIISTPQDLAPATRTQFKLLSLPSSSGSSGSVVRDEKHYSSTTVRPKYSHPPAAAQTQLRQTGKTSTQDHQGAAYQIPDIEAGALGPNVEFIYKIKTRAPLQTATVKTVSKPYMLPLKSSPVHFDHGAVLKNIEEFDLSHVVTTPEREQEGERVASKPEKLYFNSEIYHDINSLPYRPQKVRGSSNDGGGGSISSNSNINVHQDAEYRHKPKTSTDPHLYYKDYSSYFSEPATASMRLVEKQLSSSSDVEGGYPVPHQYVLKKEPLSGKYEKERDNWEQSLRLVISKPSHIDAYKAPTRDSSTLGYDSYSPKFNNNPEDYGYQHTYKTQQFRGSSTSSSMRGKRGGIPLPLSDGVSGKKQIRNNSGESGYGGRIGVSSKLVKDRDPNLALRPPPKN